MLKLNMFASRAVAHDEGRAVHRRDYWRLLPRAGRRRTHPRNPRRHAQAHDGPRACRHAALSSYVGGDLDAPGGGVGRQMRVMACAASSWWRAAELPPGIEVGQRSLLHPGKSVSTARGWTRRTPSRSEFGETPSGPRPRLARMRDNRVSNYFLVVARTKAN